MKRKLFGLLLIFILISITGILAPVSAIHAVEPGTTSVKITRLASDGKTILNQTTLTYQEMRDTLPVLGDGTTHYYFQGPVFVDNPDDRWNQAEDTNVQEKDFGAVKGTNLVDLCNLVGGMAVGDTLKVKARDGWNKTFAYKNVYQYSSLEGPMALTWYKDGTYPDTGYTDGMRLFWFADTSVNPWGIHAFGNWDWHQAADPQYYYYYVQNGQQYPTTTGLSGMIVSELTIHSTQAAPVAPNWDLNSDHACNSGDVATIGLKWGQTGSPGWIPEDVNEDGVINIGDVVAIGYHWNQAW